MRRGKLTQRQFIQRIMGHRASEAHKPHTQEEQHKMLNSLGFSGVANPAEQPAAPAVKVAPMHLEHICGSPVTHLPAKMVNGKVIKLYRCQKEGVVVEAPSKDLLWKETAVQ